jgi:hypothetical protein
MHHYNQHQDQKSLQQWLAKIFFNSDHLGGFTSYILGVPRASKRYSDPLYTFLINIHFSSIFFFVYLVITIALKWINFQEVLLKTTSKIQVKVWTKMVNFHIEHFLQYTFKCQQCQISLYINYKLSFELKEFLVIFDDF